MGEFSKLLEMTKTPKFQTQFFIGESSEKVILKHMYEKLTTEMHYTVGRLIIRKVSNLGSSPGLLGQ